MSLADQSSRVTGEAFTDLFTHLPQATWVIEAETGAHLAVNEAALRLLGYSRSEFIQLPAALVFPREDLVDVLMSSRADRERTDPVHRIVRLSSGKEEIAETTFVPVMFQNRSALLVTVLLPVRYQGYDSLAHVDLLNLASDAILVCDLEGAVTFWNQGAVRLYGWSRDEALGKQMVDLLMRDTAILETTAEAIRSKGEWSGQLNQLAKGGRKLVVNSRWTLVRDESGEPVSILVINTDLTETKNLESQFLRIQRLEGIGTLASGIAHDLNNILSPILMSVGLLRRSMVSPDQERMLGMIESSAERGAGIVKQVLTFARGVEGERVLLQPKHLISEIAKIVSQTFPKNIDVQTSFPAELWTIMGDSTQLHQVLLNLCVNSRDAMPTGGTLSIGAENLEIDVHFARMNPGAELGDHVVLRVTDSGIGMAPDVVEKIFDPFFTTKEVGKGTGLGLATVMGIVKSHDGFLTVQSEVGIGTSFRIFLPAKRQATAQQINDADQQALRGKGELVLVVDDEAPIREALVQTLQDNGYRAYTAEDGSDALALYVQRPGEIAVVLTDLAMSLMDGVALVRSLQKFDPKVRVIVSSGHCDPDQTVVLNSLGVKAFLDKPYNAAKLLSALRETLDGAAIAGRS